MGKLSDEQKLKYYRKQELAQKEISKEVREEGHIVYGARALNLYFPPHLDRHTEDYDVYAKKPFVAAKQAEKRLDRAFGGDFFQTVPAKHRGTFKVKSRVTLRGVADYTDPGKKVPSKRVGGFRVAALAYIKHNLQQNLRDRGKLFRSEKDKESLQRIQLFEKSKRRRR